MKLLSRITVSLFGSLFLKVPYAHAAFGGIYGGCPTVSGDPGKAELSCVVQYTITLAQQSIGAILVVVIVISGIMYMTSMGNAEKVGAAKKTLVGAIIGLIIVVMSRFMVNLLLTLFG